MLAEQITAKIARFAPSREAADRVSLILREQRTATGPLENNWQVRPVFPEASREGAFAALIEIEPNTHLYGTGEVAGRLERSGTSIVCWNSDHAGYGVQDRSLYQSHPWVLAVREDGSSFGVLADTTWRCEIDLEDRIAFLADGEAFSIYVIEGDSPQEVLGQLADLTGHMSMPPLWALGYHQCRWSYTPDSRVREIADGFRWRRIPCDAVWMDIDYMNRYRVFSFDHVKFPHPEKLSEWLHERGFHGVWMIDPGIATEEDDRIFQEGNERDVWVRDAEGNVATGPVWPPEVAFPDFTRPDVRDWWAGLQGTMTYIGADGLWNDMNEPALLTSRGATLDLKCQHAGGSLDAGDDSSPSLPPGPHAKYHNAYGMLMARATREGLQQQRPDRRPFVLTRANLLGGQRYAATWTGDNRARWTDLRWSITMALNLGLSGQPFVGPDIGGFLDNPTPELFARWMGVGTLLPFARAHADRDADEREPWSFGLDIESSCRRAIERRYRLLPYIYTLFRDAAVTGVPVVRPVFFADLQDPSLREEEQAFLLGDDLLVCPQLDPIIKTQHRMPKGNWAPLNLEESPDDALPTLWIRPGAALPVGQVIQHTGEWDLSELTLYCAFDENGAASCELYEDDGDGYAFAEGEYRLIRYEVRDREPAPSVSAKVIEGNWGLPERSVRIVRAE